MAQLLQHQLLLRFVLRCAEREGLTVCHMSRPRAIGFWR